MKYEALLPDRFYHIYNRGNNLENIFLEEKNYNYFLTLLQHHISPVAQIFAYCLLKNHFHLIVKTKDSVQEKFISQAFSNLFNAYAKAINKNYNRRGSLFQDRFKRILIEDEKYLRNLILYIHLNPEKHNFVEDFRTYPFSSYHAHNSENSTFVERKDVIELFESKMNFMAVHDQIRRTGLELDIDEN